MKLALPIRGSRNLGEITSFGLYILIGILIGYLVQPECEDGFDDPNHILNNFAGKFFIITLLLIAVIGGVWGFFIPRARLAIYAVAIITGLGLGTGSYRIFSILFDFHCHELLKFF